MLDSIALADTPEIQSKLDKIYRRTGVADPAMRDGASKMGDVADLRDWNGLDLTGNNDMTSLIVAATDEVNQGRLFIPNGTIVVGNLPILGGAGVQIIGESKWKTKLLVAPGTVGSILYNAAASGSSLIRIANLLIDLNGNDVDAIDFNNIGNSLVEHVYVKGAATKAEATGRGIVFRSTLAVSSYTNAAFNCKVENLSSGVAWDASGNENAAFNCEAINCNVGYDALPASGTVDTPTIHGGRAEGCNIAVRDGAIGLGAFGVRFESSSVADVEFHAGSERSIYLGCYTASSATVFKDDNLATGLFSMGGRFPVKMSEPSTSRPMYFSGRKVFSAAGSAAVAPSNTSSSVYFQDYTLHANNIALELENAAHDNRIIALRSNPADEVELLAFNRKTAAYVPVKIANATFTVNPVNKTVQTATTTVAALPAAGTPGRRAVVTDASAPYTSANVGALVVGGGANKVPVFDNGTNWVIG